MRRTPPGNALLSREDFAAAVMRRSGNRCVLCGAPAVDAHHILERKLWPDGGYYLDNGAAVCATCHLECEHTRVSVERVREAAGIAGELLLPPGFVAGVQIDKWGNTVREDGLLEWGPLEHHAGARRALAAGGKLGLFVPRGTALSCTALREHR